MYIKANLDRKLLDDIDRINFYLANELFGPHYYHTQLHPAAQLGCVPYHITVVGPIDRCFSHTEDIDHFTEKWERSSTSIEIIPTTTIRVTSNGRVLWLVNTMNLKEIGVEMSEELNSSSRHSFKGVNNYCGSEVLHITLGMVTNEEEMNCNVEIEKDLFLSILHSYRIAGFGWQA